MSTTLANQKLTAFMENNIIKIGVEAIVEKDGKILMGLRKNTVGSGQWGLPGGKLEYGEGLEDCIKREVLEETGVTITKLKFLNLVNSPREGEHFLQTLFLAEDFSGNPELKEPDKFEKWEWFDKDRLPENIFFGHLGMLDAYFHKQTILENYKIQTLKI